MTINRIVPNIAAKNPDDARAFYEGVLGLEIKMDFGWIITFASDTPTTPQISIASEGGSGAPIPDISIDVSDVNAVYEKARAGGHEIIYEICDEEWGVRRFFVRDPMGKILNILSHKS